MKRITKQQTEIVTEVLTRVGASDFDERVVKMIHRLGPETLRLQDASRYGSYALQDELSLSLLSWTENAEEVRLRVSLFFTSVIAGCSCADDPTPLDKVNEHAVLTVTLNKQRHDLEVELEPAE